jgi:predicted TIM-barrel fold metal-dependent hydrolase
VTSARLLCLLTIGIVAGAALIKTAAQPLPPVIDMHLHAMPANAQGPPPLRLCAPPPVMPTWDPAQPFLATFFALQKQPACKDPVVSPMTDVEVMNQTLAAMTRRNVFGVLSGEPARVASWMAAAPGRFFAGAELTLGRPNTVTPDQLRALRTQNTLTVLGEIANQYVGIAPDDERMEPYWALAEELDIPVAIHIGPGPPGAIYLGFRAYRARLHSALTLEETLVKHPKLRVYIMHAGYPMLDDMLAVMYAHPQVHVDTGVIVWSQPRAAFYRHLQGLVDAGFARRIMFGSDQMVWPGVIEPAIRAIEAAPFLSEEQKRDILYHNAARFLRLPQQEIDRHHGR